MSQESDFLDETPPNWIQWFCSLDDHIYLCQINEEYIKQPFNLYGLQKKIKNFNKAIQMIMRPSAPHENQIQDRVFLQTYQQATDLYGLIHSRYIATPQGLAIMRQRYLNGKFGTCPRVLCEKQNVIPIGINEDLKIARVKIYCPRCKDIYSPKKKYADIDGAFFGTTFPHLLLMTYPDIGPEFIREQYRPTIYGFKIEEQLENIPQNYDEIKQQIQMEEKNVTEIKGKKKKKKIN